MDGEGEEEYEDAGEGVEDDGIYCTCQRRIDGVGGEMIGCDNDDCPIQWVCHHPFRASVSLFCFFENEGC